MEVIVDKTERLFPYQVAGAEFLVGKRVALLADEMGLGKSAQAIRASDLLSLDRVAVICPSVAKINWLREFAKFSSLKRTIQVLGGRKDRLEDGGSVISSYDMAPALLQKLSDRDRFDVLILDESHFLKNLETKRTLAVLGRNGLIHRAARTWALSGTPAPNHYGELWPLLFTFGATKLNYDQFTDRFCTKYSLPYSETPRITGSRREAAAELKTLLEPVMLRRKKEDVMKELPPIRFDHCTVEPGPVDLEVQSTFAHFYGPGSRENALLDQLDKERKAIEAVMEVARINDPRMKNRATLEAAIALRGATANIRRYVGLQKVIPVCRIIAEELSANAYEKVIIFAVHRDVIEGIRLCLAGRTWYNFQGHKEEFKKNFRPVTLYGATPPEVRQKHIDSFMKDPKCRVFIGNIKACGTAINLTSANQIVFAEQEWTPGDNAQASMRAHRIGQTKPVFVRMFSIADSFDEKVVTALRRKTRDLVAVFDEKTPDEMLSGCDDFVSRYSDKNNEKENAAVLTEYKHGYNNETHEMNVAVGGRTPQGLTKGSEGAIDLQIEAIDKILEGE